MPWDPAKMLARKHSEARVSTAYCRVKAKDISMGGV